MAKTLEELLGKIEDIVKENREKKNAQKECESPVLTETEPEKKPEPLKNTYSVGEIILDSYEVNSSPVYGGMGCVWRVYHRNWDVELAMKRPREDKFYNASQKAAFERECEAWIKLGLHPNIVSCYYVREIDSVPTIFSEWMENGSLEDRIRDGSVYSGTEEEQKERLLDIALQFAVGLEYAHSQGLVHQDVKPANLLLTRDWDAKVSDFGLVGAMAMLTENESGRLENEATILTPNRGYTLAYCSPEQLNGELLSCRTDIYSWAVSVLELYLGDRPWYSGNALPFVCEELFEQSKVPMQEKMKDLLKRCLSEKEDDRPHDFDIIKQELMALFREMTGKEYPRLHTISEANAANSLNNRALSMLELGREEEAEKLWVTALDDNPTSTDARYNYTLFLYRKGRISGEDALLLGNSFLTGNVIFESDKVYELAGKLLFETGGREAVEDRIITDYSNSAFTGESVPFAEKLESMMKSGNLRAEYVLSRIQDIYTYERQEQLFEKSYIEISEYVEKGDFRSAAELFYSKWESPDFAPCLNRRNWLQLHEKVGRKCYSVDVLRSWTIAVVNDADASDKLSFSADSSLLLCGEKLYNALTGELIADNSGGEHHVCSTISPDGSYYLRASDRGFDQVDARSGRIIESFTNLMGSTKVLEMSPDGQCALSLGKTMTISRINLRNGMQYQYLLPSGQFRRALLSYDNRSALILTDTKLHYLTFGDMVSEQQMDIDYNQCSGIATDTQFSILLMNIVRPDGSVTKRAGIKAVNLKTGESRFFEGRDGNGTPLLLTGSPARAVFASNDIYVLYAVENKVWTYSTEQDQMMEIEEYGDAVDNCAMSRDGRILAVLAGGRLYLRRMVRSFVYADEKNVPDMESLMKLAKERSVAIAKLYPDADEEDVLRAASGQLLCAITPTRQHAHSRSRLLPYGVILCASHRGKKAEELLPLFITELEDRGVGYVSDSYALEILKEAETEAYASKWF